VVALPTLNRREIFTRNASKKRREDAESPDHANPRAKSIVAISAGGVASRNQVISQSSQPRRFSRRVSSAHYPSVGSFGSAVRIGNGQRAIARPAISTGTGLRPTKCGLPDMM
jgi:hypothetical protein